jgi:hypothetical protein
MSEEFSDIIKFQAYDLKYFADKLYSALGIPKELVSKDNELSYVKQDKYLLFNPITPMTRSTCDIFHWDFLIDKYRRPCPFSEKLGVYVLKEGQELNALSTLRMHIRWNGFQFICSDFRDRKGNIYYRKFAMGVKEPSIGYAWEHIEKGVDEYKNVELDEKYLKKKEPSVLFDPYYLGGRKGNLW